MNLFNGHDIVITELVVSSDPAYSQEIFKSLIVKNQVSCRETKRD